MQSSLDTLQSSLDTLQSSLDTAYTLQFSLDTLAPIILHLIKSNSDTGNENTFYISYSGEKKIKSDTPLFYFFFITIPHHPKNLQPHIPQSTSSPGCKYQPAHQSQHDTNQYVQNLHLIV